MPYIYQVNHFNHERRVYAKPAPQDAQCDMNFQAIRLTPEDLLMESSRKFLTSPVETLVKLATAEDPVKIVHNAAAACEHQEEELCDCDVTGITIPPVIAYHVQHLANRLNQIHRRFIQWTSNDGEQVHFQYRKPDVQVLTTSRTADPASNESPSDQWQEAVFNEETAISALIDQWYRDGIALHHAWVVETPG